jgi:HEAT repeat protein
MDTRLIRPALWPALLCAASVGMSLVRPAPVLAQAAPREIEGHTIPVPGEKVEGTTARLSEVEAELVARLAPQGQAERLLQYAISHHAGATDDIKARVKGWRGVIAFTPPLETLLDVARNGDDLRVRAAAIEIELAALNIARTPAQVDVLLAKIAANPQDARQEIFILGDLANRGLETERIYNDLRVLARSEQPLVRLQAYAAIAQIGTNETVQDLVDAFHHDPSSMVRIDGGGCGLAHCGMLTRAQRMLAIPGLIEMVEDHALAAADVSYAYRALREITDEMLPDDPRLWRQWFAVHGAETTDKFRTFENGRTP